MAYAHRHDRGLASLIIVFAEITPKVIGATYAEHIALLLASC